METIFDHNITDKEYQELGLINKETYLKIIDEESARLDLACLYHYRSNKRKVDEYLKGLSEMSVMTFKNRVFGDCLIKIKKYG